MNNQTRSCVNFINKSPTNFDQYRDVTLLFVDNVIEESATHKGKLEDETMLIKTVINQLNRLDCVTTDSQPAEYDTVDKIIFRSRPYLYFYYPVRKINLLLDIFLHNNDETLVTVYTPLDNRVSMYNDKLYTKLSDERGFLPLHQDYINNQWIENFNTSFNPAFMAETFDELSLTNDKLLQYGRENLVLVNVIGTDFSNNTFTKLAHAAHALFFA